MPEYKIIVMVPKFYKIETSDEFQASEFAHQMLKQYENKLKVKPFLYSIEKINEDKEAA